MKDEKILKKYGLDEVSIREFRSRINIPTESDRRIFTERLKSEILSQNCDMKLVEELILKGANVDAYSSGVLPERLLIKSVINATYNDKWDLVFLLLKAGASINVEAFCGNNCLFYVLFDKFIDECKVLISLGVDVNHNSYNATTPLIRAVKNNSPLIVKCLLEVGADINIKNNINESAMDIARKNKFIEIEKILQEYTEEKEMLVCDKNEKLESAVLHLAKSLRRE